MGNTPISLHELPTLPTSYYQPFPSGYLPIRKTLHSQQQRPHQQQRHLFIHSHRRTCSKSNFLLFYKYTFYFKTAYAYSVSLSQQKSVTKKKQKKWIPAFERGSWVTSFRMKTIRTMLEEVLLYLKLLWI